MVVQLWRLRIAEPVYVFVILRIDIIWHVINVLVHQVRLPA